MLAEESTAEASTDEDDGMFHTICGWCWPEEIPGMKAICGLTDTRGDSVERATTCQDKSKPMHCVVCADLAELDRCPKCNGVWW